MCSYYKTWDTTSHLVEQAEQLQIMKDYSLFILVCNKMYSVSGRLALSHYAVNLHNISHNIILSVESTDVAL